MAEDNSDQNIAQPQDGTQQTAPLPSARARGRSIGPPAVLKLLHPFMPFITSELYGALGHRRQIAVHTWPQPDAALHDAEATKAFDALRTAVDSARINLAYTDVKAPISGRIGKSEVTEGALVTAQQAGALATIQQLDPMYIDVSQSSVELLRLKKEVASGQLQVEAVTVTSANSSWPGCE